MPRKGKKLTQKMLCEAFNMLRCVCFLIYIESKSSLRYHRSRNCHMKQQFFVIHVIRILSNLLYQSIKLSTHDPYDSKHKMLKLNQTNVILLKHKHPKSSHLTPNVNELGLVKSLNFESVRAKSGKNIRDLYSENRGSCTQIV